MDTKMIGGVLLIVGTSIGAGMLALPIVTASSGFISSSLLLAVFWAIMAFSSFLVLEVNLWFPPRNNMITMARATLGKTGEIITWLSYILLLYSILAAYISGGSSLFSGLFSLTGIHAPKWVSSVLFVIVFGYIVYRGITPLDYVNRALMTAKLGTLFALIFIAFPYVDVPKLTVGNPLMLTSTVMVMVASFAFTIIIPSLRSYYGGDVKKLRLTLLIGSLIPLGCYLLWDFAILGCLPQEGEHGLQAILHRGGSVTEMTQSLSYYLNNSYITTFSSLFTTICVLTSFLGVSLGLSDFLSDGLKIQKAGQGNVIVSLLTFIPPLAIVLFYPSIFVKAVSYAGFFCVILMIFLPAAMAWSGRYHKQLAKAGDYQVAGGRLSIIVLFIVVALLMVAWFTT